ncbi:hypothetical protein [Candidatus Oscillochloris fontis]|uniref:hypothetical protein n=1 Tax=Candidatus Oscillochloris fontis TaxID=2496868 RepID=UPI00101CDF69|nr:hypothetical protein [Candidatus Oscillochloris fontis]
MSKLFSRLITASAVLICLIILVRMAIPDSFDPVRYERQILAIERTRELAPIETFAAGVLTLILPLAALIALGLLTAWGMIALFRFRHERHPDSRGLIPILGMCEVELTGLTWESVDMVAGSLRVERQLQYIPNPDQTAKTKMVLRLQPVKTEAGKRTL